MRLRSFAHLLSAFVVTSALTVTLLPGVASGQTVGPTAATECAGNRTVLLLMDVSASLPQTDPDDRRIRTAQDWVKLQSRLAREGGYVVTFGLSTFGEGSPPPDLFELPRDEQPVRDALEGLAGQKNAQNTDFIAAFQNGIEFFRARAAAGPACNTLFVFTDGAYSIDNSGTDAVRGYTASTLKVAIQNEFEAQICGPLPGTSRLAEPLSTSLRNSGLWLNFQELEIGGGVSGFSAERDQTRRVIDRLFGDRADPCRINGGTTGGGPWPPPRPYEPIACDKLTGAVPMSLVRSVVAWAENRDADVVASVGGKEVARDRQVLAFRPKANTPRQGLLTVNVQPSGRLIGCYAELAGDIQFDPENRVFAGASKSYLTATVVGKSLRESDPAINEGVIQLQATVDGRSAPVRFDTDAGNWRIEVPGPRTTAPKVEVVAVAAPGWDFTGQIASNQTSLTLVNNPLPPDLVLTGSRRYEGSGRFDTKWKVEPKSEVGGQLCVSVESPIRLADGARIVTPKVPTCGDDGGTFTIPARVQVDEALNAVTTARVPFTASIEPRGAGEIDLGASQATVPRVTLAKPPNRTAELLITIGLLLGSILLSLALLIFLTNRARRLPDPSRFVAVPVPLTRDEAGALTIDTARPVEVAHMRPVSGDRSDIDVVGGYRLSKVFTLNPFAGLVGKARSTGGQLAAYPDGHIGDGSVSIPIAFREMVLVDPAAERAVAIMPSGTAVLTANGLVSDALHRFKRDSARNQRTSTGRQPDHVIGPTAEPDPSNSGDASGPLRPPPPPRQRAGGAEPPPSSPPPRPPRPSRP